MTFKATNMIPTQLKGVSVPMSPALSRIRWATLIGSYLFGSTTMSGAGSQDWFSCFNFPTVIYGGPNYPIVGKGVCCISARLLFF